ncbi:MAG: hypothetical protein ABSF32_04420 [Ignavibacteria bacterium]
MSTPKLLQTTNNFFAKTIFLQLFLFRVNEAEYRPHGGIEG